MNNDNLQAKIVAFCMLGFIIIVTIVAIASNHALQEKIRYMQRDLDYYHTNYLRKSGYTAFWTDIKGNGINYDLRSFDGGKNWYAVQMDNSKDTLTIIGPVEVVYPGLMKILQNWDNIVAYAEKNGPITLTKPSDFKVLSDNGFTIFTNK